MQEKIRVFRLMHRLNVGGPTYHAAFLTTFMNKERFDSRLYSGNVDETEKNGDYITREYGVDPIYVPGMYRKFSPLNDLKAFIFLVKEMKRFRPQVFHSHASKAGALGRVAAFITGVPIIVHTYHGNVFSGYWNSVINSSVRFVERSLAKISTRIIVISDRQYEEIITKYHISSPKKASTVYLGLDLEKFDAVDPKVRLVFRNKYHLNDQNVAVVIVGRLDSVKNHSLFLDMISIAKEKSSKTINAFIIGDGALREDLMEKCNTLNLSYSYLDNKPEPADVHFLSWREDVDKLLSAMDVIALTSLNEGTPVSLIEGQAARLPVVSSNVGGVKDVVEDNGCNKIIDTFEPEDFAQELIDIIDSGIKKPDNSRVIRKFSYTRLVNDIEKIYSDEYNKIRVAR